MEEGGRGRMLGATGSSRRGACTKYLSRDFWTCYLSYSTGGEKSFISPIKINKKVVSDFL
jgi:hypothetical protein